MGAEGRRVRDGDGVGCGGAAAGDEVEGAAVAGGGGGRAGVAVGDARAAASEAGARGALGRRAGRDGIRDGGRRSGGVRGRPVGGRGRGARPLPAGASIGRVQGAGREHGVAFRPRGGWGRALDWTGLAVGGAGKRDAFAVGKPAGRRRRGLDLDLGAGGGLPEHEADRHGPHGRLGEGERRIGVVRGDSPKHDEVVGRGRAEGGAVARIRGGGEGAAIIRPGPKSMRHRGDVGDEPGQTAADPPTLRPRRSRCGAVSSTGRP